MAAAKKELSVMLALARPNVPKLNTKITYCIRLVRGEHNRALEYANQLSIFDEQQFRLKPARTYRSRMLKSNTVYVQYSRVTQPR